MHDKERTHERGGHKNTRPLFQWLRPRGLQADMTISYVWVTVAAVLVLEILALTLNGFSALQFTGPLIRIVLASLVIAAPVGGLFGLITTRSLVRRLHHLVLATTRFSNGDYAQRVQVSRVDEVGQLEHQFNRMAEQLVASIAQRQALAEQNARMQERARISRDLHDAVSQNLFTLRTLIDGLQEAIRAGAKAAALQPHIALLEQTTDTMTREMRALLLEMRPPQLEGLGLAEALQTLAEAYTSRLGIAVTTSISPSVALSASTEQTLLRIAQEALSNAARHANATLVTLSLALQDQMVYLTVTDNGRGMDLDESSTTHGLGLGLMQERVQELRGSFMLDTAPDQGTRLEICVPQEEEHDTRLDR
jgi:two-component system, NarL family, sensor histidine kinase LiaS